MSLMSFSRANKYLKRENIYIGLCTRLHGIDLYWLNHIPLNKVFEEKIHRHFAYNKAS